MSATLSESAAFYWAGVAYEILSPRDAIAWADALITREDEVPAGIYDLSLAPADKPKRITAALRSLHDEEDVTDATVTALLDYLGRRLRIGEISAALAIQRSYELTRRLSVDSPLWMEAMVLEENYSLAVDGIAGEVGEMEDEVAAWLMRYDGEATRFIGCAG